MGDPTGARAVRTDHPDPTLGRAAPHRDLEVGHGGYRLRGRVGQVELRELTERGLDLRSRPKLERPLLARDRATAPDRGLRDPACLPPRFAEELRPRARLAQLL